MVECLGEDQDKRSKGDGKVIGRGKQELLRYRILRGVEYYPLSVLVNRHIYTDTHVRGPYEHITSRTINPKMDTRARFGTKPLNAPRKKAPMKMNAP